MIYRSKTPLRLGFAGGGTDIESYSDIYIGYVLNATINMYAYCTIEYSDNLEFYSADISQNYISEPKVIEETINLELHKGVYNRIVKNFLNGKCPAIKISTFCEAPIGSGLGSSSAIVVAILKCFVEMYKLPLGEYDIASLGYDIERKDLGFLGGAQDQYSATFGGFNFMEFRKNSVLINPLRIRRWFQHELSSSLILYFTGVSRDSSNIISSQIDTIKYSREDKINSMHEMKESAVRMKEAILKNSMDLFIKEIKRGWEIKKNMTETITNTYLDEIYNTAMVSGAKAGKISGAGGGGFMMLVCDPIDRINIVNSLSGYGDKYKFIDFVDEGSVSWGITKK